MGVSIQSVHASRNGYFNGVCCSVSPARAHTNAHSRGFPVSKESFDRLLCHLLQVPTRGHRLDNLIRKKDVANPAAAAVQVTAGVKVRINGKNKRRN